MSTTTASPSTAQLVELARFTTRRAEEADFLAHHRRAMAAVQAAYPSLAAVSLVRLASTPEHTTWVDVALWGSEAEARRAAAACMTIPEFAACARFMAVEGTVEHGEVVARY